MKISSPAFVSMRRQLAVPAAAFLLLAAAPLAGQRRTLRMPDIPGYLTLKADFHTHTIFSDGDVWPTMRVEEAWRDGLDALAITDHLEYLPHKDYVPVRHEAGWEIARDRAAERGVLLIRGAEITRAMPPGHINAIFLTDAAALDTPEPGDAVAAAVGQGAFVFYNHPGWKQQEPDGIPKLYPLHKDWIARGWLHGIEYYNDHSAYPLVLDFARDNRLAILGDSDAHGAVSEQYLPPEHKHRVMTLVFAKERSLDALREALFARRTAVWAGDQLTGDEGLVRPLVAAAVTVSRPHHSDDKAVWFNVANGSDLPLVLIDGPSGAPSRMTLPAGGSVNVRIEKELSGRPLAYTVKNVITGNGENLMIRLTWDGGETPRRIR